MLSPQVIRRLLVLLCGLLVLAGAWFIAQPRTTIIAPSAPTPTAAIPPTPPPDRAPAQSAAAPVERMDAAPADQPAVKIVAVLPTVQGPASAQFFRWTTGYLAASPKERAALVEEGVRLAQARRPEFREIIVNDPRRALVEAVPMVVRQQLPPEVVAQLEKRVNHRADLRVYQGVPPPGEPLPAKTLTHRIAALKDGPVYVAHVFGARALDVLGTRNDALNGVSIDHHFAVNDEPVRVLETGERPDAAKEVISSCPVSGKVVVATAAAGDPIPPDVTAVETPEQTVYLCGGYHRSTYTTYLYAEGGTGGPIPVNGILPAAPTPALGMVKILYIPLTFQDQNAIPATESTCYQVMRDVSDYYLKSSFGKLTTLTTVTPPIKLPKNEAWYVQRDTSNNGDVDGLGLEMQHAREEARRIGFDYNDYDCTVVRLSGGARPTGGWGGGGNVWVYSDSVGVCAHEIGHSFGLSHANFWDTSGTSAIGPGANSEYGDQYDVMGGGSVPTDHYNVAAKNQIKWLPDNFVRNITASGLYRLYAFDQPILDPRNSYALTIVKDGLRTYWGELRQGYTGSTSRPWTDQGMLLGWKFPAGSGGNIQLIDTTPGSPYAKDDAAIALGSTFGDTESGIFITTVGVSTTTPKYIDVVVNLGSFAGNHAPTLTLASSADFVPTGTTVTFTATAIDADGDTLAYQWQHWGDTSVRIVSPNSPSITRTFSTAGSYVVSCTVSDLKGGTITREKQIVVGNGNGRFTIAGRVTASGAGVPGVLINANNINPVITDADGNYTITNLSANTYSMTPLLYGYSFTELFNNSVTVGPNFTGADFEADPLPVVTIAATDASAKENTADTATFRLTRTGDIGQPLTVFVSPATGTASTSDYTLSPAVTSGSPFNSFTIPASSATLDITVTTSNDAIAEGPETLIYALAPGSGYLIGGGGGSALVTIEDDDTVLPKISIAATTTDTVENSGAPAVFTVSRTGATDTSLTVNYLTAGTATAGSDYITLSGTVTIPVNAASATINVAPLDDPLVESLETVKLTISTSASYVIDPTATTATVNIIDDDTNVVSVIATDAVATEVDLSQPGAVADTGTFLITRTGDTSQALTVYYSFAGNTSSGVPALNGVDFEALPGVLQIPAGSASASVTIVPRWDNLGETAEQVTLQLGAGPTNYKVGSSAVATVTINDGAANAPYVEVDNISVAAEPNTNGTFKFSLKGTTAGNVTVKFALTGTATVTSDYTVTTNSTVTFDAVTGTGTVLIAGTGTNTVNVTIVPVNDSVPEDLESIICTLTPDAAYQTFAPTSSATMWLRDDDQPTVWADVQVGTSGSVTNRITEGSATLPVKFYVSRTGATTSALDVNFSLGGTATVTSDYTVTTGATLLFDNATSTGTLTIPAGAQGADVNLSIINDSAIEGTETIVFSFATGAYSKTPSATLYLDDNETNAQKVFFASSSAAGSESVGTVSIPVKLTSAATAPVSVEYAIDTGARGSTATTNNLETLAYWVRVVRTGSSVTFLQSNDGATWTQRGGAVTVAMASTSYLAGLAVTSGQSGTADAAVIDSVSITGLSAGGTFGAQVSADLGTVTPAGSDALNGGVYAISAGGGAITSGAATDAFHYVYFPVLNSVNCTVTARVVSQSAGTASRAGAMFRETTATNARFAASLAQRDGTFLQGYRATAGSASTLTSYTSILRPWWLRLQRAGNLFTASQSPDGATWTTVGTPQTMALSNEVLAGLAVSARSDGLLSTAAFDNVALTGAPPLVGRTVGYGNAQGSDSVASGISTVIGSGAQIGGSEDEGHFVAAPVTGDFTLVARVLTQSGGATNAQAGVMVRENQTYRVRNFYLGCVANAGTEFIYRDTGVTTAFGDGIDFTLPSGVLNFAIGETTKNITLNVLDDAIPEPDENVTLILRNANGAQITTPSTFTYTIIDNDSSPATFVGFAGSSTSVTEASAGTVSIPVSLSAPASTSVTVDYAVTGGSATSGSDFTFTPGTLTFAPGETVKAIPLTVLDDSISENAETVVVTLSNPANASLGSLSAHTVTISDDDAPVVSIVANDASAAEAGLDPGQFTISRTGATTSALAVTLARSGTATNGSDYNSISASTPFTFTIPANAGSATIDIVPIQDTLNEGSETVILTVNANAAYTLGTPASATVTIADDDRSTVSIVANDNNASETAGNPGQFTVTRTAPTTGSLTVTFTLSGTATNTTDYAAISTSLTFNAGESSKTIAVTPVDDLLTEGDETVILQLAAGSGTYTIGAASYDVVTIHDNDSAPALYVTSPAAQGTLVPSGEGVVVSAFVADDGAPQPVTLNWTQASGPGTATFATSNAAASAVTFSADGVYVLRITATDGQFTVSDQVTIIVGSAIAPADWIAQDMSPTTVQRGQSAQIGSSYILTGMGAGYASTTADGAHLMARQVTGDGSIVARLTTTGGAAAAPLAGVTIRDSLARSCRRAVLGYVPGSGLQFRTRTTVSASDSVTVQAGITLPVWVKLDLAGSTITASYASDVAGAPGTWSVVGAPTVFTMANNLTQIGLTATGNSTTAGVLATATFDNVTLTPAPSGPALITEDFGVSTPTASMFALNAGTYTIGGSGGLDGSGAFYGWQYYGDVMVTAKLGSATSGALNALSGIMIRESMDNGGYIHLGRIPTSSFNGYIWRTLAGGSGGGVPSFTNTIRWMRLVRRGNRVTAFHAADVSGSPGTWTQLGQPQTIIMSTPVLVGFAVDNAGGTAGVLNVATFSNLSIVQLNKAPAIDLSALPSSTVGPLTIDATVTDDSSPVPPALTTTWSSAGGPGSVTFGNASAVDTSASFPQFGNYTLRLQADDTGIVAFRDKAVTYYQSAFQQWQAQNFAGNPGDLKAAPDADPDQDGISNFLEFSLGTSPSVYNPNPVASDVVTIGTDRFMRLSVTKNAAISGLQFQVQASSDLGNATNWSASGLIIEQDTATTLRVRDSVPLGTAPVRYLRLKITGP